MLFRQQASLHHEAVSFIVDARRRFPDIDTFLDSLCDVARDELAQIVGGVDPNSSYYHGDWLADHRNVTFHYPEMHPEKAAHGAEEIYEALANAANIDSTITSHDYFGSVRFGFADDVVVQWLPDVDLRWPRHPVGTAGGSPGVGTFRSAIVSGLSRRPARGHFQHRDRRRRVEHITHQS